MLHRPNETDALALRWQRERDEGARDQLVRNHWRLIRAVGARLGKLYGIDPEDAIQEASIAFLRAIETYDPAVGALSTYFHEWARAKIGRFRDNNDPIRVPVHVREMERAVRRASAKLQSFHSNRAPRAAEIAVELGWTEAQVEATRKTAAGSGLRSCMA